MNIQINQPSKGGGGGGTRLSRGGWPGNGGAMVGVGYAAAVTMTMVTWRYGDDGGDGVMEVAVM
ncbi:hypothetical protein Tco_0069869, partial [Tanacetum coccineum]